MVVSVSVTTSGPRVNEAQVRNLLHGNNGKLYRRLAAAGRRIVFAARAQVGKDTGALAASIHYSINMAGPLPTLTVGSDNDIALLHHQGTRPHAIAARNAQFLRFSSRNRVVYSRVVSHPGTRPNKYLTDNIHLGRL